MMVCVFAAAEQWRGSHHRWQCQEETVGEVQRGPAREDVAHRPHQQRHHGRSGSLGLYRVVDVARVVGRVVIMVGHVAR